MDMAQSPAHRFGQIVGEVLEQAVEPLLSSFATRHGVYLDRKGPRAARTGRKLSWKDSNGNSHDLDFVLERNGTDRQIGQPLAFIETAWRRYTKHSRNKAQEIQGAVLPLMETYRDFSPVAAVIVAGDFTQPALTQLRSLRFEVVHFRYEQVVRAFAAVGIEAAYHEGTPDKEFADKVRKWENLPAARRRGVSHRLAQSGEAGLNKLIQRLEQAVVRRVESVRIHLLHGLSPQSFTLPEAVQFLRGYSLDAQSLPLARIELEIRFNDGNSRGGTYTLREEALATLESFL